MEGSKRRKAPQPDQIGRHSPHSQPQKRQKAGICSFFHALLDVTRIAPDFDVPNAQIEALFAGDVPEDAAGR